MKKNLLNYCYTFFFTCNTYSSSKVREGDRKPCYNKSFLFPLMKRSFMLLMGCRWCVQALGVREKNPDSLTSLSIPFPKTSSDISFYTFLFKFKCDFLNAATIHLLSHTCHWALDITFKSSLGCTPRGSARKCRMP